MIGASVPLYSWGPFPLLEVLATFGLPISTLPVQRFHGVSWLAMQEIHASLCLIVLALEQKAFEAKLEDPFCFCIV